jgi:hypothetical protein
MLIDIKDIQNTNHCSFRIICRTQNGYFDFSSAFFFNNEKLDVTELSAFVAYLGTTDIYYKDVVSGGYNYNLTDDIFLNWKDYQVNPHSYKKDRLPLERDKAFCYPTV